MKKLNVPKLVGFIAVFLFLTAFTTFTTFADDCGKHEKVFPKLTGDYFGQTPPGNEPEIFAPGLITTGMYTRDITISPDGNEIYFCVSIGNFSYNSILFTKRINGVWSKPEVAPFSGSTTHKDLEPCISPDGKRFFFGSDRGGNMDIWVMDRKNDGWGEPYNLGAPVNTEKGEFFPSVTKDGTLYFTQDDEKTGTNTIFRSRLVKGKYSTPQKMGPEINSTRHQFNAFIAPDESYIIVPTAGRKDSVGRTDYYISFRSDEDKWTGPINMGKVINTPSGLEYSPYVSPDGKYFFFMSARFRVPAELEGKRLSFDALKRIYNSPQNGKPGIFWIKADFIEKLKPNKSK